MTPDFKRLTEISYALLNKNKEGRCYHFSFILNKSKILSIGINDYSKTHPKIKEFGYHKFARLHSELDAALKLGLNDCTGLTIVNIRIDRNGNLSNSLFCNGCQNLVRNLNFKEMYYSNGDGFLKWNE